MRRLAHAASTLFLVLAPAPAFAEVDCNSPTGVGTRPCVYPEGKVVVETAFVDWTKDYAGPLRTDTILAGDTLIRVGVRRNLELQVGITFFDHERTRNIDDEETLVSNGVGEATLGFKLGLIDARNSPIELAIQPTIELPVQGLRLGGGVGGSVVLPISYDLGDRLRVSLTPEVDYNADRDTVGRHLAFGATLGLDIAASKKITTTVEYRVLRDNDPAIARTEHLAAVSAGWAVRRRVQLNLGVVKGLTARSPQIELTAGMALHFY